MDGVTPTNSFDDLYMANPFESVTSTIFAKRKAEFEKSGIKDCEDELMIESSIQTVINNCTKLLQSLPLTRYWVGRQNERQAQIDELLAQQKAATSYKEWEEISIKLDEYLNNEVWKQTKESDLYDYKLVEERLNELREARKAKDYPKLLYLVRTTWTRNTGNIGNVNLYRHSYVGTKKLIEDYIKECEKALQLLIDPSNPIDDGYLLSMLIQTRKAIGRTALVLSGGGCFGIFHIGVLSNLLELNLLPRIISGSSAGAIMASILCVQSPEETIALISTIEHRTFDIFNETNKEEGFLVYLARFLKYGTLFDNRYLRKTMIGFLGDLTFRESYNRTGRILNVTVSSVSIHEQPTLLNYLTAPNVLIWSAVCASCSLPGIFSSSTIYEKNLETGAMQEWNHASVKFVDGSVDNDLPIKRLSEMFNVDHIIACQVNPHVVPFLKMSIACVGGETENEYSAKIKAYLSYAYDLFSSEVIHYLEVMSELGIAKNLSTKLRSVLSQQYSGNVTILSDLKFTELNKLLVNPTPEFLLDATVRGTRATWPKITIIRNHCATEFALDKSIILLRSRLINMRTPAGSSPLALVNSPRNSPASWISRFEDFSRSSVQFQEPITAILSPDSSSASTAVNGMDMDIESPAFSSYKRSSFWHRPAVSPRNYIRPRSETLNIGSMSDNAQYDQIAHRQQLQRHVKPKNSVPSFRSSSHQFKKMPLDSRRRTLSTSTYSASTASPSALVARRNSNQLPNTASNSISASQPSTPYSAKIRTKDFFDRGIPIASKLTHSSGERELPTTMVSSGNKSSPTSNFERAKSAVNGISHPNNSPASVNGSPLKSKNNNAKHSFYSLVEEKDQHSGDLSEKVRHKPQSNAYKSDLSPADDYHENSTSTSVQYDNDQTENMDTDGEFYHECSGSFDDNFNDCATEEEVEEGLYDFENGDLDVFLANDDIDDGKEVDVISKVKTLNT